MEVRALGRRWPRPRDEDQRRGLAAHARLHLFPPSRPPCPRCVVAKRVHPLVPGGGKVWASPWSDGAPAAPQTPAATHLLSTYCVLGSAHGGCAEGPVHRGDNSVAGGCTGAGVRGLSPQMVLLFRKYSASPIRNSRHLRSACCDARPGLHDLTVRCSHPGTEWGPPPGQRDRGQTVVAPEAAPERQRESSEGESWRLGAESSPTPGVEPALLAVGETGEADLDSGGPSAAGAGREPRSGVWK